MTFSKREKCESFVFPKLTKKYSTWDHMQLEQVGTKETMK